MSVRVKFVKQDCWIGVYWKSTWTHMIQAVPRRRVRTNGAWFRDSLTIYICIVPCFPIIIKRSAW